MVIDGTEMVVVVEELSGPGPGVVGVVAIEPVDVHDQVEDVAGVQYHVADVEGVEGQVELEEELDEELEDAVEDVQGQEIVVQVVGQVLVGEEWLGCQPISVGQSAVFG
jgi:hypothetical protein